MGDPAGCDSWVYGGESNMKLTAQEILKLALVAAVVVFIAACGSAQPVPIINKSPDRVIPEAYQVKSADSIYNIAWAFGVDYTDIAEWTELKPPYNLSPGQVVFLQKPEVKTTALSSGVEPDPSVVATSLPDNPPAPEPSKTTQNEAAVKPVSFSSNPGKWSWPAEGNLVGKFSPDSGSNGIQIAGERGSPIHATAAGQVVYVGEGLRGYGKLIILKHSESFLSAYAHNKTLEVKEGQVIDARQQIATMGNTATESVKLHFEIRKDGKPVDPLKYLK